MIPLRILARTQATLTGVSAVSFPNAFSKLSYSYFSIIDSALCTAIRTFDVILSGLLTAPYNKLASFHLKMSPRILSLLLDFRKFCAPVLNWYPGTFGIIFYGISQTTCIHMCIYTLYYIISFICKEVLHWWRHSHRFPLSRWSLVSECRQSHVTTSGVVVRQWLHSHRFPWPQWSLVDMWHRYMCRPCISNEKFLSGVSNLFFTVSFEHN